VAGASVLSACSGTTQQQSASASDGLKNIANIFDPRWAAQQNYNRALADYQNCYAANQTNVNACENQRQIMEADVKVLSAALGSGR
jgi:fructose-bisphosphate aldolase class 1